MNIGEFSKLYNLKKSTIRYYTDTGMLIPSYTGKYPDYDGNCHRDIKDIIEYKNLGFSNSEIKSIKLIERIFLNKNDLCVNFLKRILKNKIEEHQHSIDEKTIKINKIEAKIDNITPCELNHSRGININFLRHLHCPDCKNEFILSDGVLKGTNLISASLSCSCGKNFNLSNGIISSSDFNNKLTDFSSHFKHLINPESSDVSHYSELVSLLNKASSTLKVRLSSIDHSKGIIFSYASIDLILMNIFESFNPDGLYFFCVHSLEKLSMMKYLLDRNYSFNNIVLLYSENSFPISENNKTIIDLFSIASDFGLGHAPCTIIKKLSYADCKDVIAFNVFSKKSDASPFIRNKTCLDVYNSFDLKLEETTEIGQLSIPKSLSHKFFDSNELYMELKIFSK